MRVAQREWIFLLPAEQIVIEIKKTRSSLKTRDIGEQLIIDTAHYQAHPDCKALVAFVYDPEMIVDNPRGLEKDLSGQKSGIYVQVLIFPRI